MFGRRDNEETIATRRGIDTTARGGISGGALATGVVVAQGAMLLLTALVGATLVSAGLITEGAASGAVDGTAVEIGIGVMIALLLVQFLSYMWGGHTAARMARGAGLAHGLLVPAISLLLALAIGAIAAVLQANTALSLPFGTGRLPLEGNYEVTWGIGAGIAALVAMFLGGALGGLRGEHWHTRLERDAAGELAATRTDERIGDGRREDVRHDDHSDSNEVTTGGLAGERATSEHHYDTKDVAVERDDGSTSSASEVDLREEHASGTRRDERSL